ncbi:branched-chain amino acid ABC transporter permease [Bordetella hinzii]|uniref:Branched-chain amino acid ABC transporter permease n=2 Tax=Bordetella hinzii TaxID=103855 RepID=A0AAN1RV96_9BORD|nr:branched-chain amino acid ABC transporter permease [Bordetella hinzii]AKQ54267.1 High-affinity branched-chain amino acid transport system permease protein LivH [Bordetella hinzii]AKQ58781.1 High-affinity branched-chain amino acid transport system permease protein LivH [Bordetella hinzii]AZW15937.1 branched-chain amino acid ABC transporter permease [Bordetella hinzii]KCB26199.1 branched-chain amino acid ABC transporter, permease protein [Bordetella hinzii OH87 BAL007II]KCB30847.1 branched-ch
MEFIAIINAVINGIVLGTLLSLPILAITMVFGISRFPNAATGDYMTLGAYTAVATQTWISGSLVLAVLGAGLVTALVSVFFYLWVFRALAQRSNVARLIASLGVAFVVRTTITFFAGQDQYNLEMPRMMRAWNYHGIRILPMDVYILLTAIGALAIAFLILHATPLGRRMRAVADNPDLAAASGIRARRVMLYLWILSGFFCGLGGVLLAIKAVVVPELGFELLMPMFAAVVLGGIGNPIGAVVGSLVFGISQEIATLYVGPSYKIVMAFLVLLLLLLFRPQGLFGRPMMAR